MKLEYKLDKYNKEILCDDNEEHQVMMEWEKTYMEKIIETLNPSGKVLEIGFGLGYSAYKICNFKDVKEYNVIECNPTVWNKFNNFKQDYKISRPELSVELIKGRWEDVLQLLDKYDYIFFDDYSNNDFNNKRFDSFLYEVLLNHTKIGTKISVFSITNLEHIYKNIDCINVSCSKYDIDIPDNCNYIKTNEVFIPIIIKIQEPESDLKDKLFKSKNKKTPDNLILNNILETRNKYQELVNDKKKRNPSCSLIVIDNFYNNPYETRNFILTQEFSVKGNYPGVRTQSFATQELKNALQKYVEPFGGKITHFLIPDENSNNKDIYNGSFQIATSRDRSWVHIDGFNNWAAVLYLTPDAPVSSGTSFYRFHDGTSCERDMNILKNKDQIDLYSQDLTKWIKVDTVGNVFNRLIIFNSKVFHMSMDYFGTIKEDCRLFQVFFFSTEY